MDPARRRTQERLLDLLAPQPIDFDADGDEVAADAQRYERTRDKMKAMLVAGELDQRRVEMTIEQKKFVFIAALPNDDRRLDDSDLTNRR